MQVVLRTPSELVIHDGRWATVVMGGLLTAMGGGFIWLQWTHPKGGSGNGGPWVVYVVGTTFAFAGLLILWLSADRRFVFDRTARTVSLVVQRLVHRQTTLLPFKDIDDVALEESAGMSTPANRTSSATYRVVFLMKDGTRVPWTPYLTSARASQEASAAAARSFGDWAASPGHEVQVQASIAAPKLISHPVATNWGCLAAFLSVFIAIGGGLFSLEAYRVLSWRPVSATVISSDVGVVQGSKGNTYKPVVVYSYRYAGFPYQASAATPISISGSQSWAQSIVSMYRPGSVTTAYVNPDLPYDAFLVRRLSLMPLIFVLIPVLFGLLFSWLVRVQRAQVELAQQHLVPVVNAK